VSLTEVNVYVAGTQWYGNSTQINNGSITTIATQLRNTGKMVSQ